MKEVLTRLEIFRRVSKKMRAEFEELRNDPHRGLRGQEAEGIVRDFLGAHLPARFGVGSGFILDALDAVSPQIDVIVFDAHNCPKLRCTESASVFPITNAAAVVSVRTSLNRDSIQDAWEMSETVKSMSRTEGLRTTHLLTGELVTPPARVDDFEAVVPLSILFCFQSDISLSKASEHYANLFKDRGIGRHLDLIVLLDQGLVSLATCRRDVPLGLCILRGLGGDAAEGMHVVSAVSPIGPSTLNGFLLVLLSHLVSFKGVVDHPGFNWSEMESAGELEIRYITSISGEDPDSERGELVERAHFEQFEVMVKEKKKK